MKTKRKDSVELAMYKAVGAYVEANGGKVLVAGGIQIIQWPGEPAHKFTVGIKCTGRKPTYTEPVSEPESGEQR